MSASSYDYCFLKSPPSTASKEQSELQSQCYYHGMIKRVEVLRLLKDNGDFLVRDSISHPGGYVLTGFCNSKPVHFEINRSEEGMYHFEDEKFGSIVDLIEFYHAHRKEVTSSSGFILGSPVLNSNSRASNWNNVGRVEDGLEIEAAYAPYFGKASAKAPSLQTLNRALGHRAVLNEVKKRWKDELKSEQDIYHRLWAFSDDNTKENCIKQLTKNEEHPCKLTFEQTKQDTHDYCEMDYAAMEEEDQYRENTFKSVDLKRRYSSSSHILLNTSSSQDLSAFSSSTTLNHCKVSSQSSNHLPFCCPPSVPSVGLNERAQSCHTLTSQSKKSNAPFNMMARFGSTKIDPAPLLPARSNLNLIAGSCKSVNQDEENPPCSTAQDDKQVDYDEISACDYTRLANPRKPPTPPKPTLAKLKALNQMGKELRCFVKTLCSTPSYRLGMWMTEEDCRVFRLVGENTDLLEVFVDDDKSVARQHIADRASLSQSAVRLSIQKAPNTCEVLEAWIRLAAFLVIDLGNAFSFGNILGALLEHELSSKLLKMNKCSAQLLHERILPVYNQMCQPLNCPTDHLLPFIQPYLHLFSDYVHSNLTKTMPCSKNFDERLALMCGFMKIARKMVCDKENYQKRANQLIDRGSKECDSNIKNMFANDYLKLLASG